MKIETLAQLLVIKQGAQARRVGKHLARTAQTREERAAAAAYRRTAIGALVGKTSGLMLI